MHSWFRYRVEALALLCLGCVGETPPTTDCVLGTTACGGACVSLDVDPAHCGTCGLACGPGFLCRNARCVCEATTCGEDCVDTEASPAHCGGCDQACEEGFFCAEGRCETTCSDGLLSCGGACIDPTTDRDHCGSCSPCPAGATCEAGRCECRAGLVACGDACVDLEVDPDHCGSCGNACGTAEGCGDSGCGLACGSRLCDAGQAVWSRALPALNARVDIGGVVNFPSGAVGVVGTFEGDLEVGDGERRSALGRDLFIARFDAQGQPQWVRRFGAEGVTLTASGAAAEGELLVIGGSVDGEVTFDTQTVTPSDADVLFAVFTEEGQTASVEAFGGPGRQVGLDVAFTAAGYVVGGTFDVALQRGEGELAASGGPEDTDGFALGIAADGTTTWTEIFAGDRRQAIEHVAAGDGSVVLLGRQDGSAATWGGSAIGQAPLAVAGLSPAGALRFLGTVDENATSGTVDVAGDRLVFGFNFSGAMAFDVDGCPPPPPVSAVGTDGLVLSLDLATGCADGAGTWLTGSGRQAVRALRARADGAVWIAGETDGEDLEIDGAVALADAGDDEGFITHRGSGSDWTTRLGSHTCEDRSCRLSMSEGRLVFATTFRGTMVLPPSALASAGGAGDGGLALLRP